MENKKQLEIRFSGFQDDWKLYKLGDLVERQKSYSLSRDVQSIEETGYRYIHYGDIHTGKASFITNDSNIPNIKAGNYDFLQKGDLIVADASEDHTGIATPSIVMDNPKFKLVAGLHTIAMRPQNVFPIYLYYLLNSQTFKKYGNKIGTGMKVFGISFVNLAKFETLIPNFEEQKEIGSFLNKVDETISFKQQEIAMLKQTKQGFLQKMFPKEGEKVPEVRFPGFTEDWEQRKLSEIVKLIGGNAFSSGDSSKEGIPWMKIANVSKNGIDWSNQSFLPSEFWDKYPDYRLTRGDYVMALTRPILNHALKIGKVDKPALLNQRVAKLDCMLDKEYTFQLLQRRTVVNKIENELAGTDPPNLGSKNLTNIDVEVSKNIGEQQKIGSFFKQFDESIALHQRELELLQLTKKAFLQKLFV